MTEDIAVIIPFNTPASQEPRCSFCKKSKSQIKRLIASQLNKHICDECITKCTKLMRDTL